MRTLTVILIIASFLQTSILPINLVQIILICRAYLRSDRMNLFLAFGIGLLISHLSLTPLGFQSIIYLSLVSIAQLLSSPLASHPLWIVPLSFILLSINMLVQSFFVYPSINFTQVLIESLLSLPIFYFLREWEERFTIKREIKLKV